MLPKKAPEPGTGWGCVVCGLSADGAVAVVCDRCLESKKPIQSAIKGFAKSGQRVPVTSLVGEHKHNEQLHKLEEN